MRGSLPLRGSVLVVSLLGAACAYSPATVPPSAPPSPGAKLPPGPSGMAAAGAFSTVELQRIEAMRPHVEQAAQVHGVDPNLINAVIWVESRFDPRAHSPAGARGLMQLMPATARHLADQLKVRPRVYDPSFNVTAGTFFLSRLLERYDGDEFLALAAYHSGPGTVDGWRNSGKAPDYSQRYTQLVRDAKVRFVQLAAARHRPLTHDRALAHQRRPAAPALPPTPGERQSVASDQPSRASSANTPSPPVRSSPVASPYDGRPMEPRGPGMDPSLAPPAEPALPRPSPVTTQDPHPAPPGDASPPASDLDVPHPGGPADVPPVRTPTAPDPADPAPVHPAPVNPAPVDPVDIEPPAPEVGLGVLPSLHDL